MTRWTKAMLLNTAMVVAMTGGGLLMTGCEQKPEHRMKMAQIQLNNDKPDKALENVDAVLVVQPENLDAMTLRVQALIALRRYPEARTTLDKLLEKDPQSGKARRLMVNWARGSISQALTQSTFTSEPALQKQFDEAMLAGASQASWLRTQEKATIEADYYEALFTLLDVARLDQFIADYTGRLTGAALPGVIMPTQDDPEKISRLQQERERQIGKAESLFEQVMNADPSYLDAGVRYVALLQQRQKWSELWLLSSKAAQSTTLSPQFASELVLSLVNMPSAMHSVDERMALGWKLHDAVDDQRKSAPEMKITEARLHLKSEQYANARTVLNQLVKQDPNSQIARFLLAQAHYGEKNYAEARKILDKLSIELSNRPEVLTLHGMVLADMGEPELALGSLRAALKFDPSNITAQAKIIDLRSQMNQLQSVSTEINDLYKKHPNDPRYVRLKLNFEQMNGRHDDVLGVLEKTQTIAPLLPGHLDALVDGYIYLERYPDARKWAQQLVAADPDNLEAHLKLAGVLLAMREDQQVRDMLVELSAKFPDASSIDHMLGQLYLQRGMADRAAETLVGVVNKNPKNTDARLLLARAYAQLSQMSDALDQVKAVLDTDPQNVQAHAMAYRIYQFTNQLQEAEFHLQQVTEEQIKEADQPALLAQLRLRENRIQEAEEICGRAISSGNADPMLRLLLSAIYRSKGKLAEAETTLTGMIRQHPDNMQSYALLARFYQDTGQLDQGVEKLVKLQTNNEALARTAQATLLAAGKRYDEAISRIEPMLSALIREKHALAVPVTEQLAGIYADKGDLAAAGAIYDGVIKAGIRVPQMKLRQINQTRSILGREETIAQLKQLISSLSPDEMLVRAQIIQQVTALGDVDSAMAMVDQWLRERPDMPALWKQKAELYMLAGNTKPALEAFTKARDLNKDNAAVWLRLAQATAQSGDYPAAEALMEEMTTVDAGFRNAALASLGQMYLQLGLTDQAVAAFERLERESNPSDPRVLMAMGQAYLRLDRQSQAATRLGEIKSYTQQYVPAQILLARILRNAGKGDEARRMLLKLVENRLIAPQVSLELMRLDVTDGATTDLIAWAQQGLPTEALSPEFQRQWLQTRILSADRQQQWQEAADTLEKLSRLNDKPMPPVTAGRVVLQLRLRNTERARQLLVSDAELLKSPMGVLLSVALGQNPPDNFTLPPLQAMLVQMVRGKLDAARVSAESVPPSVLFYRNDLLLTIDRPDLASPAVMRAMQMTAAAMVAQELQLYQLASSLATDAITEVNSFVPAHAILLDAQTKLGKDMATDSTDRRMIGGSSLALFISARQRMNARNFTGARDEFKTLSEQNPGNFLILSNLIEMMRRTGQIDPAIALLEKEAAGPAPHPEIGNVLAYLLAEYKPQRLDEAARIAKGVYDASKNSPELLDTLGWIEYKQGQQEQALAHLVQCNVALRDLGEVHYHLGMVYQAMGNKKWATYHFTQAAKDGGDLEYVKQAKEQLAKR